MPERIEEAISRFLCSRDTDLEKFLQERAIDFERIAKSRTYLLLDQESLEKKRLEILAYFSLAPQVLFLPEDLSGNQRKKLDGFSGTINKIPVSALPVILIGQLAKNDRYCDDITGDTVIAYIFSMIEIIHNYMGGRIVTVDVRKEARGLVPFYEKYGFKALKENSDARFLQMIHLLCPQKL